MRGTVVASKSQWPGFWELMLVRLFYDISELKGGSFDGICASVPEWSEKGMLKQPMDGWGRPMLCRPYKLFRNIRCRTWVRSLGLRSVSGVGQLPYTFRTELWRGRVESLNANWMLVH